MIPETDTALVIKEKTAQVVNGGLPVEKHGDDREVFFDLKLVLLLTMADLDQLLDPEGAMDMSPSRLLFNQETQQKLLPDFEIGGKLRQKISGELKVTGDKGEPMVFEGAHLVGKANAVEIVGGGHASMTLNFRLDPDEKQLALCRRLVVAGTCSIDFREVLEDAPPEPDENQERLPTV